MSHQYHHEDVMMDATRGLRADWTHAHKSTRSDNSGPYCVEVAPAWYSSARTAYGEEVWHKSRASMQDGNCVEVADLPDGVAVRNSRDKQGPVLFFTSEQWTDFINFVKES